MLTNSKPIRLYAENYVDGNGVGFDPRSFAQELEELFREHYQLVYRTAYGITGRAEDAEDARLTPIAPITRPSAATGTPPSIGSNFGTFTKLPPDPWKCVRIASNLVSVPEIDSPM